ncbi:3',5'-cyclic-AMP phosphodiesterase 4D-like [Dendrobates tinctorius]|uniref:3',5'-cyclic-AMP phosphodiesterase 4D-like n=1 Tax=Dendrobates tinctorius TaxID=92724 RepID=UPI003CC93495
MNKQNSPLYAGGKSVSDEALHSKMEEDDGIPEGMEPYLVRRLSCRNIQLPPLAFRLAEQAEWEKKPDCESPQRPTSLALRIPPLIAITAADSTRFSCLIMVVRFNLCLSAKFSLMFHPIPRLTASFGRTSLWMPYLYLLIGFFMHIYSAFLECFSFVHMLILPPILMNFS